MRIQFKSACLQCGPTACSKCGYNPHVECRRKTSFSAPSEGAVSASASKFWRSVAIAPTCSWAQRTLLHPSTPSTRAPESSFLHAGTHAHGGRNGCSQTYLHRHSIAIQGHAQCSAWLAAKRGRRSQCFTAHNSGWPYAMGTVCSPSDAGAGRRIRLRCGMCPIQRS